VIAEETAVAPSKIIWDGQMYLIETDTANISKCIYTNEPSQYGILLSQRRTASLFYHADCQRSVTNITDVTGTVTDYYVYKAFGITLRADGVSLNSFRYIGTMGYLYNNALYYIRRRWYAYDTAKWISYDPFGIHDMQNGYAYSNNRPIVESDPSGLLAYSMRSSPKITGCGTYEWNAQFVLNPYQKNGYIIQRVRMTYEVHRCCPNTLLVRSDVCPPSARSNPPPPPTRTCEYWEMWIVRNGRIWWSAPPYEPTRPDPNYEDTFAFRLPNYGRLTRSTIPLHEEGLLYWYDGFTPPGTWAIWSNPGTPTHCTPAGALVTSNTAPAGIVSTGSGRFVTTTWNCCNPLILRDDFRWGFTNSV